MGKIDSVIDRIENNFRIHPTTKRQEHRIGEIRSIAKDLALMIHRNAPDSREKSLALTHLETALMWSREAVSRNE